jgi:hypothetical protein
MCALLGYRKTWQPRTNSRLIMRGSEWRREARRRARASTHQKRGVVVERQQATPKRLCKISEKYYI